MHSAVRRAAFALVLISLPVTASAAGVRVLFDARNPERTLFPSDQFAVIDFTQNTFERVHLPKPDCSAQPLACEDIDVLNTLDGFNPQPRLTIPFSGAIDPASVTSDTIFLVSLGSTLGGGSFGRKVGINQIVWDPASLTVHAESDELLEPHTRYALIVTSGVRDAQGHAIAGSSVDEEAVKALDRTREHRRDRVVAATVFTTLSTTSVLEKIRDQVKAGAVAPVDFAIGTNGERAVFPFSPAVSGVQHRQVGTSTFADIPLPTILLTGLALPGTGAIGQLAYGRFSSPNFLTPGAFITPIGSRTGKPVVHGASTIYFSLFTPATPKPANGWPVAIVGHGFGDSREGLPFTVAGSLARQGIATLAINVVGHGGGPLGTITITTPTQTVTFSSGGRGVDQNGDGAIDGTEGSSAVRPSSLRGSTDGLRQTVTDLMQLVREVQAGIDVDGDGAPDLDPARIYYTGQSFGGIYGTMFLAVEPDVHVGVPNVPGGPAIEIIRLSPFFRNTLFAPAVALHGLVNNPGGATPGDQIIENIPLRGEPVRINDVPGAMALQELIDRSQWAAEVGDPVTYAPHVRKSPLAGMTAKSVIIQFGKGDQIVPNPTQTALVRAGELADRVTYFRTDLFYATQPRPLPAGVLPPLYPHTFLNTFASPGSVAVSLQAQAQIATFFASNGGVTIDPDGPGPLFETPIALPLPETLNFLTP
ncbi:MAG TPA: Ig-like domain-containing protein [Kofleriaceae bacterium]|nr:Ig-like domain-containing protein [Kofleriaceae bacterium]